MTWFRPLPTAATRTISVLVLVAWGGSMTFLVNRSYLQASASNLATDLARYGSAAQWHGVYYRGEKIGFTVGQTIPTEDGFELQEDGRLQMSLLGANTAATIRTTAQVDRDFALRSFEFSLDPGTGPIRVRGTVTGKRLSLTVTTAGGSRTEVRDLAEPPILTLNLSRRLASGGLIPRARHQWTVFDPATLRNAPVVLDVGERELVRTGNGRIPAFRIDMEFAGIHTTSWVTDTGEVVREESPMGLISVKESPENARAMAVSGQMRSDLLKESAIVPVGKPRIDEPRNVQHLRLRLEGADLSHLDLDGDGQRVAGNVIDIDDFGRLPAGTEPDVRQYLSAEPFIESDAPEILAEAQLAVRGVTGNRMRAEALTRYVNAIIQKKPTMSLPSAREVLRTRIGDCNEHTVLYVAMARALGLPARIAAGVAYVHGAFYYHAWPEVYVDEGGSRGLWLPVDPTFNQFPADSTHLRLLRGGLDKQAAILPLIGQLKITLLEVDVAPGSSPILIGQSTMDVEPAFAPVPQRQSTGCDCP